MQKKMKLFVKYFFSKCEYIQRTLRICSYLLKKSLTENFFFSAAFTDQIIMENLDGINSVSFLTFSGGMKIEHCTEMGY